MNFNKEKIDKWYQAIPLGNGNIGGLLFGDGRRVKLNVDCSSLWDVREGKSVTDENYKFSEILRLVSMGEGANEELQARFGSFSEPYPTKIPCGAFEIEPLADGECEFFFSMSEALGGVNIGEKGKIESFFSPCTHLGYIRLPKGVNFSFVPPKYQSENGDVKSGELATLGYPEGKVTVANNTIIYRQPTSSGSYSVISKFDTGADYTDIVFDVRIQDDTRGDDEIIAALSSALNRGYDRDFAEHKRWWCNYFNKVCVTLPKEYRHISELYDYAHYLIGSGSRPGFAPMALQGVWTAADGTLPPWRGDYHFDLNVQGTYNWAYRANRLDEVYPLIDYFIKNKENIEKFSKKFFECDDAFFIPGTADIKGNIAGGWVQYTYSLTSSMWMLIVLDAWCDYTHDEDYKINSHIPMLKGTFNLLDKVFLAEKGEKYELVISASPEINDCKYSAWLKNSTYDVSIVKVFLNKYIQRLEDIGEPCDRAKDILSRLVDESIGESGYLLSENFPLGVTHRHFAQCMNIFPFQVLDYRNPDDLNLINRCISHLESLGTKLWVGFSFVWMAALYATAADGDGAIKYLDIFADAFISDNGFHLNGDQKKKGYSNYVYCPFTLEGNFMFAEALQEMLLQYHHGVLRFFPAIPAEFRAKGCSFSGLRIDADITVSAHVLGERVECTLINDGKGREMIISAGAREVKIHVAHGKNSIIIYI